MMTRSKDSPARFNAKNLLGLRFGRLIVIASTNKRKNACLVWSCRCDCGAIKDISSAHLIHKHVQSCGCLWRERRWSKRGTAGLRRVFESYKSNAKRRGLVFSLSLNQFEEMIVKDCFYCSKSKTQSAVGKGSKDFSDHSRFYYTGIDRINSQDGYTQQNCVSCCKTCNYAKNDLTIEEFKTWINAVYTNLCGLNN